MKRQLTVFAAILTLVIPSVSTAASPRPGPYLSGFIGVTATENTDVRSYDYFTDNSFSDRVEFDPGINFGGTAGYDYGFVRLEGELSYKYAEIATITNKVNNQQLHSPDGNIGVFAMMFNSFFDLHNASPVTPYLGGGIGFATMHLSDTYVAEYGPPIYEQDDDSVFACQVGTGLEIALNRELSLDVGYRYFVTSKANFGSDGYIATDLRFKSHNVAVGLRAKF